MEGSAYARRDSTLCIILTDCFFEITDYSAD